MAYRARTAELIPQAIFTRDSELAIVAIEALAAMAACRTEGVESYISVAYPTVEVVVASRLSSLLTSGQVEEARRLADRMKNATAAGMLPVSGESLYNIACTYSRLAVVEKTEAARERLDLEAVVTLRQAFDAGFRRHLIYMNSEVGAAPFEFMLKDPDLAPLQTRQDYLQLLTDLRTKQNR